MFANVWTLTDQFPLDTCKNSMANVLLLNVSSTHEGWLVGSFGFNGPLRQYFSLYQAVSQREGEREEKG